MKKYPLREASERSGMDQGFIIHCVEREWVSPVEPQSWVFDEEDLARLQLIRELMDEMGANESAVPIILHLLDQLYFLQSKLAQLKRAS